MLAAVNGYLDATAPNGQKAPIDNLKETTFSHSGWSEDAGWQSRDDRTEVDDVRDRVLVERISIKPVDANKTGPINVQFISHYELFAAVERVNYLALGYISKNNIWYNPNRPNQLAYVDAQGKEVAEQIRRAQDRKRSEGCTIL